MTPTETGGPSPEEMGIVNVETQKEKGRDEEKRIDQLFKECSFMHVEDDPRAVAAITEALRTKRNGEKGKEDPNTKTATTVDEVEPVFRKLIENHSLSEDSRIVVIQDMELPQNEFSQSNSQGGLESMKKMVAMVKEWNTEHTDQPIKLEIIINSTIGDERMKGFNQDLGGNFIKAVARPAEIGKGRRQKVDVVQDIEELFREYLKDQTEK